MQVTLNIEKILQRWDNTMSAIIVYTTLAGDVLDRICWIYYGRYIGTTPVVMEANPLLRDQPVTLPGGIDIVLPEIVEEIETKLVRVWDS